MEKGTEVQLLTKAADLVQNVSVVADDFINTYSYDGLNRMISVVQDNQTGGTANAVADKRVNVTYNALGQFTYIERYQSTSVKYPGLRTVFNYDAGNRLSSIAHRHVTSESNSTLLSDYAYSYDNVSRITAVNSSVDGNSAFNYDQTHHDQAARRSQRVQAFAAKTPLVPHDFPAPSLVFYRASREMFIDTRNKTGDLGLNCYRSSGLLKLNFLGATGSAGAL